MKKYFNLLILLTLSTTLSSCDFLKKHYKSLNPFSQEKAATKPQKEISIKSIELANNENYILHEVLTTETIASIARKHHVSAETIISYNYIKKPYILKKGQMLKIPQSSNKDEDLIESLDALDKDKKKNKLIQIAPKE